MVFDLSSALGVSAAPKTKPAANAKTQPFLRFMAVSFSRMVSVPPHAQPRETCRVRFASARNLSERELVYPIPNRTLFFGGNSRSYLQLCDHRVIGQFQDVKNCLSDFLGLHLPRALFLCPLVLS